jgi:hypothetical protein
MEIPSDWLAEAGLQDYTPLRQSSFRCSAPHELIALVDIEPLVRARPLTRNGFCHDRMVSVLEGIRNDATFEEPIFIVRQTGSLPYRLYGGVHRYYASVRLGFTHVPAQIILDPRHADF